jgi:hypothetical protein
MFRALGRLVVATAAGAGLGAVAAIAKNRLSDTGAGARDTWNDEPAPPITHPDPAAFDTSSEVGEPIVSPVLESDPPPAPPASADIADLDDARRRLRERAAELRAEMERNVGP